MTISLKTGRPIYERKHLHNFSTFYGNLKIKFGSVFFSYAKGGNLFIKPTLTADRFSEDFLYNGVLDLNQEGCNVDIDGGCVV